MLPLLLALMLSLPGCSIHPEAPLLPPELEVQTSTPPAGLEVGQPFEISLAIKNSGATRAHLTAIRLPAAFLNTAQYEGSHPALSLTTLEGGEGLIRLSVTLSPAEETDITFRFIPLSGGDLSALGAVETDEASFPFQLQASISGLLGAAKAQSSSASPAPLGKIPWPALVQIKAMVEVDGKEQLGWSGSGAILTPDGLILTSAHVVLSDRFYTVKELIVALTVAQDQPAVDTYTASIVQADSAADLALIRPRTNLQGVPLVPGSLNLPAVSLGNSDALNLGDELTVLGYPAIGGETITLTRGVVSGFTADEVFGSRAFIKTNAVIVGGNSGGMALNQAGELVGVPTLIGSGDVQTGVIDCRTLADTNRDGLIDEQDSCVPTGGFINAMRPVALAQPLIEAAKRGEVAFKAPYAVPQSFSPAGTLLFADDFSDPLSGWQVGQAAAFQRGYEDGRYILQIRQDHFVLWSDQPYNLAGATLQVEATVLNSAGNGDYGLVCGIQDDEHFTALEISEDGYYAIWKQQGSEFVTLLDWTYAPELTTGGPYTLGASCGPEGLLLAVDGLLLAEVQDETFAGGRVGLLAGTYDHAGLKVAFDHFEVFTP